MPKETESTNLLSKPTSTSTSTSTANSISYQSLQAPISRPLLRRKSTDYDRSTSTSTLLSENNGLREWYLDYSSIDWIHDLIKSRTRQRAINKTSGLRGALLKLYDSIQGILIVTIIGILSGIVAAIIVLLSESLSSLKEGICINNLFLNQVKCCGGKSKQGNLNCYEFQTWSKFFHWDVNSFGPIFDFLVYFIIAVTLAIGTGSLVFYNGYKKKTKDGEDKICYYAAGSGIPEVKTILSGFVIRGFLGIKTLTVKTAGLILSVSSGLSLGKEGPLVHISCCIGNIVTRFFEKYNLNEAKQREILSASSAAGVAVAFGAPIGGVLFSLEEVSYYFPIHTLYRSFLCAMVAAMTLKIINPFGTGKIVLFQVTFENTWWTFELLPFLLLGVFGGIYGALFCKLNILWNKKRRTSNWGKLPVYEVLTVVCITTVLNYMNPFTRLSTTELVADLFSECKTNNDGNSGLCLSQLSNYDQVIQLLGLAIIEKFLLTVITFGMKVPAGVFIPSMAIGACFGRIIGLMLQQFQQIYPTFYLFSVCGEVGTNCFTPGVYAMVGAASALAGVTRMTVSLVVIMFELTNSLSYGLPIMLAVMISKWTGDALVHNSIYDNLIELNEYPYLHKGNHYQNLNELKDIMDNNLPIINCNQVNTIQSLKLKLTDMQNYGYSDGGFPIVDDNILIGYINFNDLQHVLEKYPNNSLIINFNTNSIPLNEIDELVFQFIDQAPITIAHNSSADILLEMFIKLGVRYICILKLGKFIGVIHKKRLLAYLRELE